MSELLAELPASALVPEGYYGARAPAPGVVAALLGSLALANIVARRDALDIATKLAQEQLGLTLPRGPHTASAGDLTLVGIGPGRFLVVGEGITGDPLLARLAHAFGNTVALTDQSDGQLVIQISGPRTRDMLAKLVPIDLDPSVFKPGDAASTLVALIPVLIWQVDPAPVYRFAVPRSFGPAFLRALVGAGAEFGLQLTGTGRG
ncbi:sarcosine oxidase subunit gamma [Roseixanthobacter glucoisosaccharinicivorans]|uniref:sarcosine oxidase subunit gamma n=1 Tax=Roseixanthobacter glucoisosaccharinicivorans TaxID=3119923 RepID=UPI0037290651